MTLEHSPPGRSTGPAPPVQRRRDADLPQIDLPTAPQPAPAFERQFFACLAAQGRVRLVLDEGDSLAGRVEGVDDDGAPLWSQDLAEVAAAIPCFTAGTSIMTAAGPVPVEDLRPGDRIITRDAGAQPLLWSGQRDFCWRALGLLPMLRPVRVSPGVLGPGLPARDMLLSPNHLLLAERPATADSPAEEMFLPARDLLGQPGIDVAPLTEVRYLHLLLDRHHAILSEGCWSESLRPDPAAMVGLTEASRSALAGAGFGMDPAPSCRAIAGPRAA
ncbi:Hint domain-containing protein [Frigidibacter sp.]|uniref:Hint domain-containing protein n=1 Tax=Frigidibacter sp. TaxID=2586418 RepID=UPI00273372D6|nr:Hint domain-containing protein [Frigidibacter sp.]MDP3339941.1 Hint domain-containing protein [Frigidibacter sp.]